MGSTKKPLPLLLVGAALVAAIVAVYGQMRGHDAIRYDDLDYVTNNYVVQAGLTAEGLEWAFTTNTLSNWHPLTWLSHMLDCELFGMDMGMHHLTSLVLHAISAVLLLLLLHQWTGALWRPALVAALFALHPLNVESVAWIAERKNVLSTMFWFLTTMSYVAWVRDRKASRYALTLVLFALGLMSKPMLVTLPCTLLLLDDWPLGRMPSKAAFRSLFVEKLPFFALAMASSVVTYVVQHEVAVAALESVPLLSRVGNAVISYGAYLGDAVWPRHLALLYPLRPVAWIAVLGAGLVLSTITWAVIKARTLHPYLLVGWLWYLGTLVPVIGIVQVGSQRMADRYVYIPLVGVFVMIAWGLGALVSHRPQTKNTVAAFSGIALLALAAVTHRQTALWRDSVTVFEHTLAVTGDNPIMQNELGIALGRVGRHQEAIAHLTESQRLMPDSDQVLTNLGEAYASLNRLEEATAHYREALAKKPDSFAAHTALGFALARLRRTDEAMAHYQEALRLNPEYSEVHLGLASLYESQKRNREAIEHYRETLRLKPSSIEARTNLGALLATGREFAEAIEHFRVVLRMDPTRLAARNNLGYALDAQGKLDEAAAEFAASLEIDPNQPQIRMKLTALRNR
jgi:tetratricopeptide (TPR) repeat protein